MSGKTIEAENTTMASGAGRVIVRVPGPLRSLADGRAEVAVAGRTVGAALNDLVARHPRLRRHLRADAGGLREYVNVYLNDEDVRYLEGETTPVAAGDTLTLVASVAGG